MEDTIIHIVKPIKIFFTYIRSRNSKLVKTYKSDGSKVAGANLSWGNYWTLCVDSLASLDLLFKGMTQFDTITLGVTSNLAGNVVTAKMLEKLKYDSSTISRSKSCIFFLNDIFAYNESEHSLYIFDIDFDKNSPKSFQVNTHEEVRNLLISINPNFGQIEMLIRDSSSSCIKNVITGEYRNQNRSFHIYMIISHATKENVSNFTNYLKRRCWELGLATAKINGIGIVESYAFDFKVPEPERLIFEASPDTEYPYIHEYTPSSINKGGILNLKTFEKEDENIYKEYFLNQKQRLIEKNPSLKLKNVSNIILSSNERTSIISTTDNSGIYINESVVEKLNAIYNYFETHDRINVKDVLKLFDEEIVKLILKFFGFQIDEYSNMFKIREERTASASIRSDGFIRDFGGDFGGNIINFIMYLFELEFIVAWKYIQNMFGKNHKIKNKTKTLRDPKDFEKSLRINESIIRL